MKNKLYLFVFLLQVLALSVHAARVDTVFVKSPSMNREVKVVYILPDKVVAGNPQACPVIYLLHGYGGNARTWIGVKPELPRIADEKGVIFACPDGKNSWYWDSPRNSAYRYETFISQLSGNGRISTPPLILPAAPNISLWRMAFHNAPCPTMLKPLIARAPFLGIVAVGRACRQ